MKRQALSFFIIFSVFCAYYFLKHIRFSNQTALEQTEKFITVGTNAEYKPFVFIANDNAINGFDIDVMNAVAKKIGLSIKYKDLPFEALMGELHNGTIDCMIGGINPTAERAQQVLFADPIYANDPLVIVYPKNGLPLKSMQDLAHKKVIVNEGYFADSFLSKHAHITLVRLTSNLPTDGLLALQNGQADAFVGSKSTTLPLFSAQQKNLFDNTIIHEAVEQDAFAVSKNNHKLLVDINNAIAALKNDGTLDTFIKKWFLTDSEQK